MALTKIVKGNRVKVTRLNNPDRDHRMVDKEGEVIGVVNPDSKDPRYRVRLDTHTSASFQRDELELLY